MRFFSKISGNFSNMCNRFYWYRIRKEIKGVETRTALEGSWDSFYWYTIMLIKMTQAGIHFCKNGIESDRYIMGYEFIDDKVSKSDLEFAIKKVIESSNSVYIGDIVKNNERQYYAMLRVEGNKAIITIKNWTLDLTKESKTYTWNENKELVKSPCYCSTSKKEFEIENIKSISYTKLIEYIDKRLNEYKDYLNIKGLEIEKPALESLLRNEAINILPEEYGMISDYIKTKIRGRIVHIHDIFELRKKWIKLSQIDWSDDKYNSESTKKSFELYSKDKKVIWSEVHKMFEEHLDEFWD